MSEEKPRRWQFGLMALFGVVACAAAVFAFIKAAPAVAFAILLGAVLFEAQFGFLFDFVMRRLEQEGRTNVWAIIATIFCIAFGVTVAFLGPFLVLAVFGSIRCNG